VRFIDFLVFHVLVGGMSVDMLTDVYNVAQEISTTLQMCTAL